LCNLSPAFAKNICKKEPAAGFPDFLNRAHQKSVKQLTMIILIPFLDFNRMPAFRHLAEVYMMVATGQPLTPGYTHFSFSEQAFTWLHENYWSKKTENLL